MSYEQYLIPAVSSIISVFAGLFTGRHLSDRKEKQKNNEELEKIKDLIIRDFRTVRRLTNEGLTNQQHTVKYILEGKEKPSEYHDLLKPNIYFPYWPTLVNSGKLLKLKPYEILTVQSLHDKILELYEEHQVVLERGLKKLSSEKDEYKKIHAYIDLLQLSTKTHKIILKMLDMIEIEWITFDKNKDAIQVRDSIHDKPVITKNGITIYPDGTKVDSHGTIL